jgi:mono/diheme cytochrome c family protein/plastocyanin
MNTNKQINAMILLVFVSVLATAFYTLWDPDRASEAEDEQLHATVRRGAYLFSQNCRTCHGDAGEGGGASDRLREAPALNRPDLQGESEDGEITDVSFSNAYRLVFNTITCGRVGKAMPVWGQAQGGTLNDEQVKQLTVFITQGGDEGWEIARGWAQHGEHEFHIEGDNRNGLELAEAVGESDTTLTLNKAATVVNPNERLSIVDEEGNAVEIFLVQEVNPDTNTVIVERGVGSTSPAAHAAGIAVLQPPSPPEDPAIVAQSCGQLAQAAPTLPPPDPTADLTITAQGIAWDYTALSAIAGQPATITVQNNDDGTAHNWVLFDGEDADAPRIAETPIENGVVTQTVDFGPLEAGDYYYNCEVHPFQMEGTLTAYPPGEGPAAATADATPAP